MSTLCSASTFADFCASVQTNGVSSTHVVLGNEAGDADSIISALTLAYVDRDKMGKTPVVSIPRADLALRRETVQLLQLAKVEQEQLNSLLYIDDLDKLGQVKKVTLVDHNRLTLSNVDWTVAEILDHHYDEFAHPDVANELRQVAFDNEKESALVASTCTLVAERLFATASPPFPSDLALLLLGVILLDTVNMIPAAGKVTDRDRAAISRLLKDSEWSTLSGRAASFLRENDDGTQSIETNELYQFLSDSKFDLAFWNELSVTDALRLDYKQFQAGESDGAFGASSVLLPMSAFLNKKDLQVQIAEFMETRQIPLLVVGSMTVKEEGPERQLLLCGKEGLVGDMASFLVDQGTLLELQEVPVEFRQDEDTQDLVLRHFAQGNSKASRKQVAPIMLQFYR